MARYQVLSWGGIPAQVKARGAAGRPVSRPLPDLFQQEIDREAVRTGMVGSDDYLAGWTWSDEDERPGTADEVADAIVAELVAAWSSGPKPRAEPQAEPRGEPDRGGIG